MENSWSSIPKFGWKPCLYIFWKKRLFIHPVITGRGRNFCLQRFLTGLAGLVYLTLLFTMICKYHLCICRSSNWFSNSSSSIIGHRDPALSADRGQSYSTTWREIPREPVSWQLTQSCISACQAPRTTQSGCYKDYCACMLHIRWGIRLLFPGAFYLPPFPLPSLSWLCQGMAD